MEGILRLNYLGRVAVSGGILLASLVGLGVSGPDQTIAALMIFIGAVAFTAWSYHLTHRDRIKPIVSFRVAQSVFDALLTTAVVHVTGGAQSPFIPVYVLVLTFAALMLPAWGLLLVWALTTTLFVGNVIFAHPETFSGSTLVLLALFALLALVTGWLGAGLRRAGLSLGAVESELRQLRLDTGDILANLTTGLMTVDSWGRLAYINHAAERILGLAANDWVSHEVLEEVERRAPGLGDVIQRSITDGRSSERLKVPATVDGDEVVLGVSTAVLKREEQAQASVTVIFQDITDVEKVEALKIRAERLEAVAELSASLAHEIKNPLASIRSSVEQISKPTLEDADRQVLHELVLLESDRLSRLLSEFIDFARIRSGKTETVDLPELIRGALALALQHPDLPEDLKVEQEGLDRALLVRGDGDLLHRATFNLVLNALQYAGAHGRIRVTLEGPLERVDPRVPDVPNPILISVEDSGPGVATEDIDRVFDPFYTTRKGGSGLGLAVVHRAMDAHEGSVVLETSALGGARFVMVLPAREPVGASG